MDERESVPGYQPDMTTTPPLPPLVRRGLRARMFAWALAHSGDAERKLYGERKQALFGNACGTIVEIGAGAGPNAEYFESGATWLAVEPNVHFHPHLRHQAERFGLHLTIVPGTAEALPLHNASADMVVSTLVLCSVSDPALAVAEARRVLRPGGRFVFVEHVAADPGTWLRRMQRWLRGPWSAVADGCKPDRDTEATLRAAGFSEVCVERFRAPLGLAAPHIAGVATGP